MTSVERRNIEIVAPSLAKVLALQSGLDFCPVTEEERRAEEAECRRCADPDPRVRTLAVQELERLCAGGRMISIDSYPVVAQMCTNTAKNVRLSALRLIQKLAARYPEHLIRTERGFEVRLHDDAFALVCHAMNDIETDVRTEAARLLGRFDCVSDHFLEQTLDKKVMKATAFRETAGRRRGGTSTAPSSSSWSVGKKLGEDAPGETDDDEAESIIPIGACGAFVAGLEDEFMSVRQAAVYSLGRLAANRAEFARASIDHLADMFNDEMQQVRLDSIEALTPLIIHGTLDKAQLHTILNVLSDAIADNRLALHELLGKANLADHLCVGQVLKALQDSMKRFPRDRDSIYRCLSQIARRHSFFIQPLVPELLNVHPLFDTHEQDINDEFYLCNLILVLNAAYVQPAMCATIPEHIVRHYRYMRQSSPALIPVIPDFERVKKTNRFQLTLQSESGAARNSVLKHIQLVYKRIRDAYSDTVQEEKRAMLKLILRDLKVSRNVDEEFAGPLQFLKCMCEALLLYDACIQGRFEEQTLLSVAEECLGLLAQLLHLFDGVHRRLRAFLLEMELQLKVQAILHRLAAEPHADWSGVSELIQAEMVEVQRQVVVEVGAQPSAGNARLYDFMFTLLKGHEEEARSSSASAKPSKKPALAPLLSTELSQLDYELKRARLPLPDNEADLRRLRRKTAAPLELWHAGVYYSHEAAGPLRFVAGIPAGIDVYSSLNNLSEADRKRLRIEVRYPDDRRTYQPLGDRDLTPHNEQELRLHSSVLISADEPWAVPGELRFSVGLLLRDDTAGNNQHSHTSSAVSSAAQRHAAGLDPQPKFVPLISADRPAWRYFTELKIFPMSRC